MNRLTKMAVIRGMIMIPGIIIIKIRGNNVLGVGDIDIRKILRYSN